MPRIDDDDGDVPRRAPVLDEVDPFYMALLRARQRRFTECIDIWHRDLGAEPLRSAWVTKTKALTQETYIDDSELEEDGAADLLLDDNVMASMPRPGTSLNRPNTRAGTSAGGRSGSAPPCRRRADRSVDSPGLARALDQGLAACRWDRALQGKPTWHVSPSDDTRPSSSTGHSVHAVGRTTGVFIDVNRLDLKRYAARPAIAKVLVDYLLYHEHNPRKALELAAEATVAADYKDWVVEGAAGQVLLSVGALSGC
ncbi:hypothetical protein PINS_up016029 [Pythium insidiosum]|nr:hypothetical protein PINS_up016029 [Pythium insidiosum]